MCANISNTFCNDIYVIVNVIIVLTQEKYNNIPIDVHLSLKCKQQHVMLHTNFDNLQNTLLMIVKYKL